jgi:predicted metalloprotease with PDZ domain
MIRRFWVLTSCLAVLGGPAFAQETPKPLPMPAALPAAQDVAYPGAISLHVDATDIDRRIFRVHETVPAKPGELILLAPKWLPGNHQPSGEVSKMSGFVFTGGGKALTWTRDPVEVNAFHVQVPEGVSEVTVDFQYLAPVTENIGRIVVTPDMLNLQWTVTSLYPAGYYVSRIPVNASVKLPEGWGQGSALEASNVATDNTVTFKPTNYDTLIDSPLFAGRYFKRLDLDPKGKVDVHLDVVADKASSLNVPDDVLAIHRKLIQQAYRLYGAHHYDHYDFLVAATDTLGGIGLEHHQSSENSVDPDYFTDWKTQFVGRDLLAHEFSHSWNGKYRRPADLWTPDFQMPMRNSLLWVYEGQTQYWGYVLAARSGLLSKDQYLGALANTAAYYDNLSARQWRDLQDTTNDPIIADRPAESWPNWQASEEYYNQGALIWLDADTLIREKTGGKKSLDDFAKAFFGVNDGARDELTYTFDDVVKTLNGVYPYDWANFLKARLNDHGQKPPFDGITRAGYKLVYTDTPTDYFKARETRLKFASFQYSLGLSLGKDGAVRAVLWDSLAYKAGLTIGAQIVAVNGRAYDADDLKAAIKAAAPGKDGKPGSADPIELLIKTGDRYKTIKIDYHGGLRYPKLEPIPGMHDVWGAILQEK